MWRRYCVVLLPLASLGVRWRLHAFRKYDAPVAEP